MDMQTGLALYWWQRLITFNSDRIRVKYKIITCAYKARSVLKAVFVDQPGNLRMEITRSTDQRVPGSEPWVWHV